MSSRIYTPRSAPYGTHTNQLLEIIQEHNEPLTIKQLSKITGLSYRTVISLISSLERQNKIISINQDLARKNRVYKIWPNTSQHKTKRQAEMISEVHQIMNRIIRNKHQSTQLGQSIQY